jgi:cytochrome c-type protein NapB
MANQISKFVMGLAFLAVCVVAGLVAARWLWSGSEEPVEQPSSLRVRAGHRAYDGAPPVIPHDAFGVQCIRCHTPTGQPIPGVGVAPANPHLHTQGLSEASRCQQCHVFSTTVKVLVGSDFEGVRQSDRKGERLYPGAPPVIPHPLFMREDCNACHSGPAARPEIRCSHPERTRCLQCHARPPIALH